MGISFKDLQEAARRRAQPVPAKAGLPPAEKEFGGRAPEASRPAPGDSTELTGRKVKSLTASSRVGDAMEITPSCSIVLNSLYGCPAFRIRHDASGTTQEFSPIGGSGSFVSDEGLLITVSGKNWALEASVGKKVSAVLPVFSSGKETPAATPDGKAKRSMTLSNKLLEAGASNVKIADLGHGLFLMQSGTMFDMHDRNVTDAHQGYVLFHVNPAAGRMESDFCKTFGHPTPDVPYVRHFGLHVGTQREFRLGDERVIMQLEQSGNVLFTHLRFY